MIRDRIGWSAAFLAVPACLIVVGSLPISGAAATGDRLAQATPSARASAGAAGLSGPFAVEAEPQQSDTGTAASAPAPSVPPISARKALSRARGALDKNQEAEALRYYEQVLVQEPLPGSRRAEALYWAGLLHTHADPELRDFGRARECFQELLSVHPTHERRREAQAALALLGQLDAAREESDGLRAQISHRDDACAEEKTRLVERARAAEEAASAVQAETQSLKSEVKTLRGEVQSLRSELEKRDEALRKVREALVGKRARK